jgi:hypothetical protein
VKQLTGFPSILQTLRAKSMVKSQKEPVYAKYEKEIDTMIKSLSEFLGNCEMKIAVAESLGADEAEDRLYEKTATELQGLVSGAEHHLMGAKAAKIRFTNL